MTREKLSRAGEGLVVTAVGLLFLLLSLTIPDNPVSVPGTAGLLAQARALPLLLSAAMTAVGVGHTVALWRGRVRTEAAVPAGRGWMPALATTVYLIVTAAWGFLLPTMAYLLVMLVLWGRGEKQRLPLLVGLALLYGAVALWLIPGLLRLRLM